MWVRVLAIALLALTVVVGIVLASQPTGMASRMTEREVDELVRRSRDQREGDGSGAPSPRDVTEDPPEAAGQ